MTSWARRSFLPFALLSVALVGCRPSPQEQPAHTPAPPGAAASVSETPAKTREPDRCVPSLPPAGRPGASGPAYVLVDRVGVLRIDDGGVATVLELASDRGSWGSDLVVMPTGELWLSDWHGISVLGRAGEVRQLRLARGGPRYEALAPRSPADVWAVTSDIEWAVVHYDGERWTPVRRRGQFPGRYDDNKFVALVVTGDAVWVSCWNGLWRGAGDDWRRIDLPGERDSFYGLWVYRDRVIAGGSGGYFLRDGAGWKELRWPAQARLNRGVGDIGLVAAPSLEEPTVTIGPVDGEGCTATSDAIQGSHILDLAVDDAGRTWVATDHALAVVDRGGRMIAEWTPGTLAGLTGRILRVAVVGAGPERLPAPQAARTWELVGRLEIYKNGKALAGAEVELCSSPASDDRCERTAFARKTTSRADGSFRFTDVPEGQFSILVRPLPDTADCDGVFSVTGGQVAPARDCRVAPSGPRTCDLGTLTQCLPFEMPPPPPGH